MFPLFIQAPETTLDNSQGSGVLLEQTAMSVAGAGSEPEESRNVLLQSIVQTATDYGAGLEKYYALQLHREEHRTTSG